MMEQITYESLLASAPKHDVTRNEFERLACEADWEKRTSDLYLRPPLFKGYVLVGKIALRVID